MRPVGTNIEKAFTVSGYKEGSGYNYVLLVDFAGNTLIKRIKVDNSEMKFAFRGSETTIEYFWANYADQDFKWIHELRNE